MFKKDFDIDIIDYKYSIDGRRLLINFNYQSPKFCIVNAYAPNNETARINFFKRLGTWIPQNTCNKLGTILCGDLNCCIENIDRNTNEPIAHRIFLKVYYCS